MRDNNDKSIYRRAVGETILLAIVFLIALALFVGTIYFIATREAAHELQNRPKGLLLGWLTTLALGLVLGKTRQDAADTLPIPLLIVRETLQALMLLFFCGVLAYAAYFLYTTRGLALQRPWALLVGWFAFLVFIAVLAKIGSIVKTAKNRET